MLSQSIILVIVVQFDKLMIGFIKSSVMIFILRRFTILLWVY